MDNSVSDQLEALAHAFLVADDLLRGALKNNKSPIARPGTKCSLIFMPDPRMPPDVLAIGDATGGIQVQQLTRDRREQSDGYSDTDD